MPRHVVRLLQAGRRVELIRSRLHGNPPAMHLISERNGDILGASPGQGYGFAPTVAEHRGQDMAWRGRLIRAYEGAIRRRMTFRYAAEFERNQWLSVDELRELQWVRLRALLSHAYATVPHYREACSAVACTPDDIRCTADIARLPILAKADIRANADALLSTGYPPAVLIRSASGGSTGEPVQFRYDRNSYERRVAAAMRGDSWAGWRLCGGEFYIWGAPLLPQSRWKRLKGAAYHSALRRHVCSSFGLSPSAVALAAKRYNRIGPRVVVGYAHAVYEFALMAERVGYALAPPKGVITSAEVLYPFQREVIERVFGARVFNRYGCREVMMIGAECEEHSGLHATIDNLYIEILKDGRQCEPGETGEVVVTDLYNYGMPFIRYRTGDLARWKGEPCRCGRGLPLIGSVEGRVLDVIRTPDGLTVSGGLFPHLLKDFDFVRRYQVVQDRLDHITVHVQTAGAADPHALQALKAAVSHSLGTEVAISWDVGPHVQVPETLKFRPVQSLLGERLGFAEHASEGGER